MKELIEMKGSTVNLILSNRFAGRYEEISVS